MLNENDQHTPPKTTKLLLDFKEEVFGMKELDFGEEKNQLDPSINVRIFDEDEQDSFNDEDEQELFNDEIEIDQTNILI